MTGKRRSFSNEFKAEAVEMVLNGESIAEVAELMDVNRSTLQNWVNATRGADPGPEEIPIAIAAEPKPRKEEAPQKFVRRRIHAWQRRDK